MINIIEKLLLVVLICIFGCRTVQNQNRGSFFSEAFPLTPPTLIRGKDIRIHIRSDKRCKKIYPGNSRLFGGQDDGDAAKALQEKAAALRKEVEAFEATKQEESDQLQKEVEDKQREKDELRQRYSAVVPILKGNGDVVMERCDFPPRMTKIPESDDDDARPLSRIIAFQAPLPLGIVLGQDEQLPVNQRPTTIDVVAKGGNGEAAGIRIGDCLRATSACQVTMEQPTWQLLAGGIGRPKTTRMMFSTDNKMFEEVMDAIASNAMDPESRDVWLVVERMDDEEPVGVEENGGSDE